MLPCLLLYLNAMCPYMMELAFQQFNSRLSLATKLTPMDAHDSDLVFKFYDATL